MHHHICKEWLLMKWGGGVFRLPTADYVAN